MPVASNATIDRLRRGPPEIEWFLAVAPCGDPIFRARINDATITQSARTIVFDNATGSYLNVEPGMTLWVGNAWNAYDVGTVRIKAVTATTLTVAENDDILWADGLWLTVPGEAGFREPWSVLPRLTEVGGVVTFYKDYDKVYTDEGDHLPPKANGGCAAIGEIDPLVGQVTLNFVGEDSYATELGEIISDTLWTFPDGNPATSILEGTVAAPIPVVWDSGGFRYVKLDVVDTLGTTGTTHIPVWIFDERTNTTPYNRVEVLDVSESDAGVRVSLRVFGADPIDFADRSLVALGVRTWYGGESIEIGGYPYRENVYVSGWIVGSTIHFDDQNEDITFEIITTDSLAQTLPGFSFYLEHNDAPSIWIEMDTPTADRIKQYHFEYHTTINQISHVEQFGEGATREVPRRGFPETDPYTQIQRHMYDGVKNTIICDRQGIFRVRRDPQMMNAADRNTVPVVTTIESSDEGSDWLGDVDVMVRHRPDIGMLELGGFVAAGNTPLLSKAPGEAPAQTSGKPRLNGHVLVNQAEANLWSGLEWSRRATRWSAVHLRLRGFWPIFGPALQEYVRTGFTDPWGVGPSPNTRCVVREVNIAVNPTRKTAVTEIVVEPESTVISGTTLVVPPPPPPGPPPGVPPVIITPIDPPQTATINDRHKAYGTPSFHLVNPVWRDITGVLNGVIFAVEVDQYDQAGAWALTGTDNKDTDDDAANVGLWRTDDVSAAVPVWNLVFTQAQGKANQYMFSDCDAWGAPAWGQMRSLVSSGPGECVVGEARWVGLGGALGDATSLFRVDGAGGFSLANAEVGPSGVDCTGWCHICGMCGSDAPVNPGAKFHQEGAYMVQSNLRGCHQLYPPYYGLPAVVCGAVSRYNELFCISAPAPIHIGPSPGNPDAVDHQGGARHIIYHKGKWWGYAERNVAGTNEGAVYNTLDGEVDDNLSFNFGFCNITSHPDHIWWCKYDPGAPRAQKLILDGVDTCVSSNDMFGTGSFGGIIGHLRAIWDEDNTVVLVRKDPPVIANVSIIWVYDTVNGLRNKTGNLGNVWEGTGGKLPGTGAWNYRYDNVSFSAFGVPLK